MRDTHAVPRSVEISQALTQWPPTVRALGQTKVVAVVVPARWRSQGSHMILGGIVPHCESTSADMLYCVSTRLNVWLGSVGNAR